MPDLDQTARECRAVMERLRQLAKDHASGKTPLPWDEMRTLMKQYESLMGGLEPVYGRPSQTTKHPRPDSGAIMERLRQLAKDHVSGNSPLPWEEMRSLMKQYNTLFDELHPAITATQQLKEDSGGSRPPSGQSQN